MLLRALCFLLSLAVVDVIIIITIFRYNNNTIIHTHVTLNRNACRHGDTFVVSEIFSITT